MKPLPILNPQTLKDVNEDLAKLKPSTYKLLIVIVVGLMFVVCAMTFFVASLFDFLEPSQPLRHLGAGLLALIASLVMLIKPNWFIRFVKR